MNNLDNLLDIWYKENDCSPIISIRFIKSKSREEYLKYKEDKEKRINTEQWRDNLKEYAITEKPINNEVAILETRPIKHKRGKNINDPTIAQERGLSSTRVKIAKTIKEVIPISFDDEKPIEAYFCSEPREIKNLNDLVKSWVYDYTEPWAYDYFKPLLDEFKVPNEFKNVDCQTDDDGLKSLQRDLEILRIGQVVRDVFSSIGKESQASEEVKTNEESEVEVGTVSKQLEEYLNSFYKALQTNDVVKKMFAESKELYKRRDLLILDISKRMLDYILEL